jgi:hypothetical protein
LVAEKTKLLEFGRIVEGLVATYHQAARVSHALQQVWRKNRSKKP